MNFLNLAYILLFNQILKHLIKRGIIYEKENS